MSSVVSHQGHERLNILKEARDDEERKYILKNKRVDNAIHLIFGGVGSGKSVLTESMAYDFYKAGYTVIIMTTKEGNEYDFGYAMFTPEDKFHLAGLLEEKQQPLAVPVKFYHPLTLDIGKDDSNSEKVRKIPEHIFYTYPLKSISIDALRALYPSDSDAIAIATTNQIIKRLPKSATILDFMWECYKSLNKDKDKEIISLMEELNYLPIDSMGTIQTLKLIINSFTQFNDHPFLQPMGYQYSLDMEKIINDQEHYHLFSNRWIPTQLKYFELLCRIEAIESVLKQEKAKHRVCLVFEEIETLLRITNKTKFEEEFGQKIKRFLAINRVKGVTSLCNTQNYYETDGAFRKKATKKYIMKCGSDDSARLLKEHPYIGSENIAKIELFKKGQFFFWEKIQEGTVYRTHLPPHAHAEEGSKFFETVERRMPEMMKDYKLLVHQLEQERKQQLELSKKKAEEIVQEMNVSNAATEKEKVSYKLEKTQRDLGLSRKKYHEVKREQKEILLQRAYTLKKENPSIYWNDIAKQIQKEFNEPTYSYKTAQRHALKWAEKVGDLAFSMKQLREGDKIA